MKLNLNAMTTETRNPNTMNLAEGTAEEAKIRLERADGHVRDAIRG